MLWNMLSGWLVATRIQRKTLRMRVYRISSRDFLVVFVLRGDGCSDSQIALIFLNAKVSDRVIKAR
jgi:hypothetical protein